EGDAIKFCKYLEDKGIVKIKSEHGIVYEHILNENLYKIWRNEKPRLSTDALKEALEKLPFGVYLGSVIFENAVHRAIINWGGRGGEPAVEAHILNFNGSLYDKEIIIAFQKKLRNEIVFSSLDALRAQIIRDISSL
ncbi:riboflavin biosynthesis protein RibF, partial [Candidatus Gastranaerophilus sp. (ex Termes propinquus)]